MFTQLTQNANLCHFDSKYLLQMLRRSRIAKRPLLSWGAKLKVVSSRHACKLNPYPGAYCFLRSLKLTAIPNS